MSEVRDTRSMLIEVRSSIPDIVGDYNQSNIQTWNDMFHNMIDKCDQGSEYPKGSVPHKIILRIVQNLYSSLICRLDLTKTKYRKRKKKHPFTSVFLQTHHEKIVLPPYALSPLKFIHMNCKHRKPGLHYLEQGFFALKMINCTLLISVEHHFNKLLQNSNNVDIITRQRKGRHHSIATVVLLHVLNFQNSPQMGGHKSYQDHILHPNQVKSDMN